MGKFFPKLFAAIVAFTALAAPTAPSNAQTAFVVATCGTLPGTAVWSPRQSRPLTIDINGVLCTSSSGGGGGGTPAEDVDVTSVVPGTGATNLGKAEDAAHTSGDVGVMSLAVRNDAGTALAGTTGDYIPLTTDSTGALRALVTGTGTFATQAAQSGTWNIGTLATITNPVAVTGTFWQATQPVSAASLPLPTGAATAAKQPALGTAGSASTDVITVQGIASGTPQPVSGTVAATQSGTWNVGTVTPGTAATNLGKAEDAAHTSGDVGVMGLAVRVDSAATLAGTDGDYAPLQVDASGALRVTGGTAGTEYTEDAAAAANPTGGMMMAVRRDTLSASEVSADGDNIALKATSKGELHVSDTDLLAAVNSAIPAGTNIIGKVGIDQTTDGTTNLVVAKQATAANLNATVVGTGTFATQAVPTAGTTGGATPFHLVAANTNNSTSVKGSAGVVYSVQTSNVSASTVAYLKLYNKATAPTCGTDTPVKVIGIPANDHLGGNNVNLGSVGVAFSLGVGICVVTGIADNNNTAVAASTITIAIDYK